MPSNNIEHAMVCDSSVELALILLNDFELYAIYIVIGCNRRTKITWVSETVSSNWAKIWDLEMTLEYLCDISNCSFAIM
jgi:hypothetical protein